MAWAGEDRIMISFVESVVSTSPVPYPYAHLEGAGEARGGRLSEVRTWLGLREV